MLIIIMLLAGILSSSSGCVHSMIGRFAIWFTRCERSGKNCWIITVFLIRSALRCLSRRRRAAACRSRFGHGGRARRERERAREQVREREGAGARRSYPPGSRAAWRQDGCGADVGDELPVARSVARSVATGKEDDAAFADNPLASLSFLQL